MKRKDILTLIHKTLTLLAPNTEYNLGNYDIFKLHNGEYVQIYTLNNKVIYVESNMSVPSEISTLFELRKLSNEECSKVYSIINKYAALKDNIGLCTGKSNIYEATPIYNLLDEEGVTKR